MAIGTEVLDQGGSATPPARGLVVSRARTTRRIRIDLWASRLVIIGGITIIAAILAILFVIAAEVAPLWRSPSATLLGAASTGAPPAPGEGAGVNEYRELAYEVTAAGQVAFASLVDKGAPAPVAVPALEGATVTAVGGGGKGRHAIGTSDGRVLPLVVAFDAAYPEGRRTVTPKVTFGDPVVLDSEGRRPVQRLALATGGAGPIAVAQLGQRALMVHSVVEKKALVGGTRREEPTRRLELPGEGSITVLRLDNRGEDLFVGTSTGRLHRVDLRDPGSPAAVEAVAVRADRAPAVTALQ